VKLNCLLKHITHCCAMLNTAHCKILDVGLRVIIKMHRIYEMSLEITRLIEGIHTYTVHNANSITE